MKKCDCEEKYKYKIQKERYKYLSSSPQNNHGFDFSEARAIIGFILFMLMLALIDCKC